jgi:hypothetical protein
MAGGRIAEKSRQGEGCNGERRVGNGRIDGREGLFFIGTRSPTLTGIYERFFGRSMLRLLVY